MLLRIGALLLLSLCLLGVHCLPARLQDDFDDVDPQIVGGNSVTIEQYPHQISMEKYGSHDCGGSIISKKWVLTAAHCLYSSGSTDDVGVRYGSTTQGSGGTLVAAKWTGYHPQYVHALHRHDVALIQVAEDIVFSSVARPIKMIAVGDEPRGTDTLTVSGWGVTDSYDYYGPSDLYAVQVPYVPRAVCNAAYVSSGSKQIDDSMICAGSNGKDSCQGDSGGPLINGLGILVGVVSWGIGCGEPGYAGVYANLGDAINRDFIQNYTGIA